MHYITTRRIKVIKDGNARRITITPELHEVGWSGMDELYITVAEKKGIRKIMIERA
jgi:hypothetical protein